ncbi:hypothetical protein EIK56_20130 [Sphingomonas sp. C8-2]|nr:hypothetical protein EIK56_20130 [Sphingomonas sp. C8-2]
MASGIPFHRHPGGGRDLGRGEKRSRQEPPEMPASAGMTDWGRPLRPRIDVIGGDTYLHRDHLRGGREAARAPLSQGPCLKECPCSAASPKPSSDRRTIVM